RAQVAGAWHVSELPTAAGRDASAILAAATDGTLGALLVGGVEPDDFAEPDAVLAALDAAGFVVSLELRHSAVTERADVVFPVAPTTQKAGAFVNWEGRFRPFEPALRGSTQQASQSDHQVLDALADEMGVYLGASDVASAREEIAALGLWDGERAATPDVAAAAPARPDAGEAVLTGWRMLLDNGLLQDGEPHLAGTARKPVARLSAATAAELGAADGYPITVSTPHGSIRLPLAITDMPDRVVWLPVNSPGSAVHRQLGVGLGSTVRIGAAS
ncbi:molybdopterin dinucleotide binding domain-containing protein, partial [Mycobacterium sp. E1214]